MESPEPTDHVAAVSPDAHNLLTTAEVAAELRVSPATVAYWRSQRSGARGPKYVRIGKLVRYHRVDVNEYIQNLRNGGAEEAST